MSEGVRFAPGAGQRRRSGRPSSSWGSASDSTRPSSAESRCFSSRSSRWPGWSWPRGAASSTARPGRDGSRRASHIRCGSCCGGRWCRRPGGELIDPLLDRGRPGRAALVAAARARRLAGAPGPAQAGARAPGGPRPARALAAGARLGPLRRARRPAADRPGALGRARARSPLGSHPDPGRASDATSRRGGLAQFEVDGLRPYREGSPGVADPLARRGAERRDDRAAADRRRRASAAASSSTRAAATATQRERAMRAAASLCVELARSGGCDLLVPGERRALSIDPSLRTWPEAHVRIAVSDPHSGPPMPQGGSGAAVLWVTAGTLPPPHPYAGCGPGATSSRRAAPAGPPSSGSRAASPTRSGAGERTAPGRRAAA